MKKIVRSIERQLLAETAAERWRHQYADKFAKQCDGCQPRELSCSQCAWARVIHAELLDLGTNPSPDDVDAIIGNDGWTHVPACDECGSKTAEVIIQFSASDDDALSVCSECVKKAASL